MSQARGGGRITTGLIDQGKIMDYTSRILSGWLANSSNSCRIEDLREYISDIYEIVAQQIASDKNAFRNAANVTTEDTVYPEYIICLEDGKRLKMLKRHLWSRYNMTLEEYKKKWNLGYDYPTVAPNYAKKRSLIAKTIKKNKIS